MNEVKWLSVYVCVTNDTFIVEITTLTIIVCWQSTEQDALAHILSV